MARPYGGAPTVEMPSGHQGRYANGSTTCLALFLIGVGAGVLVLVRWIG
ncbi:hypothetical protein [Nocardioides sp. CER19]|nr:hypothetical protein [Nocardioides sp. CER19]MDH2413414.1 hypothetical protein [Nocardioides sp. CER19]